MSLSRLSKMLFAVVVSAVLMTAKTIRVPNDYPNLQAAHDAANPGDTIVITVDTPGALISKQLTIQGTGAAAISAAVGDFGGATYGIGLKSGASGTLIRNVTIDVSSAGPRPQLGIVTGGSFGSAASNVTVKQSNIVETFQGISGRCYNNSCPTGWTVSQNDISLNSGPAVDPAHGVTAYIGIIAFNGADNWTIIHNEVTRPDTLAPAFTDNCFSGIAGIEVLSTASPAFQPSPIEISGVAVKQNHVSVLGECTIVPTVAGSCGTSVVTFAGCAESVNVASEGTNTLSTVGYNDLRGSNFSTLVFASQDPSTTRSSCGAQSDDLTGLHQYGYVSDTGSVTCLTALGNLDDFGNGNRGSTSNSIARPGTILPK